MSQVTTSLTELPESRVRVEAQVAAAEIERRVQQAASALGRELRVPGFRQGKVPATVVIRRVGRAAVLDEAVREALTSWYSDAIDAAGIRPVGDPDVDLGDLPGEGQPLTFSIEVGVRPPAQLGEYKGLDVVRREIIVAEEKIDEEIELLRERVAKLESVEHVAADGDFVVMDYVGSIDGEEFPGGTGDDQLIGLGSGRLVDDFEQQLEGAVAGEHRTITVTFPDTYKATELAGRAAVFEVDVKDVKSKVLPELDDDFASDHAGVDTYAELREEIRGRLAHADEHALEAEFRDAVLDAAAARATVEVPETLVTARAHEFWHQMMSSLSRQGISKETYLQIVGRDEEQILADARPDAAQALLREAVLDAIVAAEGEAVAPSREELLEAVAHEAEHEKMKPEKLLTRIERAGKLDALAQDLAARKALDMLVESAKPVAEPPAGGDSGKLWTPGS